LLTSILVSNIYIQVIFYVVLGLGTQVKYQLKWSKVPQIVRELSGNVVVFGKWSLCTSVNAIRLHTLVHGLFNTVASFDVLVRKKTSWPNGTKLGHRKL